MMKNRMLIFTALFTCAMSLFACDKTSTENTNGGEPTIPNFTVTTTDIYASRATFTVTPNDGVETFYYSIISKANFDSKYATDADCIAADLVVFNTYATDYNMTLSDYLTEYVLRDQAATRTVGTLAADTEYYIYVYGMDATGTCTFPLEKYLFRTNKFTVSDNTFDIQISDISTTGAKIAVTATNNDPYFFDIWESSLLEGKNDSEIIAYAIEDYGTDISYCIETGDASLDTTGYQDPNTKYTVLVFGYDAGATTVLSKKVYTTPDAGSPADCTFTFDEANLTSSEVDITVTPSEKAFNYYFDMIPVNEFVSDKGITDGIKTLFESYAEKYGMTVSEIVNSYVSKGVDTNYFYIDAATEYYVYAYVMDSDASALSPVSKKKITTPAASGATDKGIKRTTTVGKHVILAKQFNGMRRLIR